MKFSVYSEEHYMKEALKEAKQAIENDEVPVGAVIVCDKKIIARAHNYTEKLNDVTAHAEILALTSASQHLNSKYLDECTLYVTLEPCAMCASALNWSQIKNLVFGAFDPKKGYTIYKPSLVHPKTLVKGGILEDECSALIKEFFKSKR